MTVINEFVPVKIEYEKCSQINLTSAELETLENAMSIIRLFQQSIDNDSDDCDIMSTTTGEIIHMNEIPRVLGVLSGICDNEEWITL